MNDTLNSTSALALLLTEHPGGFSVDANGVLSVRQTATKITGAAQLRDLARKPHLLKVDLHGSVFEIEVQVLTDKQINAINRLIPSPTPKPKTKIEGGRQVPDGFDRQDPKFLEEVERVYCLRRAVSLATAIPSLEVVGNSPEEKATFLEENFPANLIECLYAGVRTLAVDTVAERASFLPVNG